MSGFRHVLGKLGLTVREKSKCFYGKLKNVDIQSI